MSTTLRVLRRPARWGVVITAALALIVGGAGLASAETGQRLLSAPNAIQMPYNFDYAYRTTVYDGSQRHFYLRVGEGIQATYPLQTLAVTLTGPNGAVGLTQELWSGGRACPRWTANATGRYTLRFDVLQGSSRRVRVNRFFYPGFLSTEGKQSDPFACPVL
ncbi:hypothetical protein [Actinoplanes sp. NPDC049118]|uniref:hypothetical protein n=1 Tax=Actinoplanes sp. NPDC049118 TaxID=3155769 RepID=UPI00340F4631